MHSSMAGCVVILWPRGV